MNSMRFGEYLYVGGFIQKKQPQDHCHTLQTGHPTTTIDSICENYERTPEGSRRHHDEAWLRLHCSGPASPWGRPHGLAWAG
jgi:hypothetical protein